MAKRTKYTATFSNGQTLKRSTDSRTYSHAWLLTYTVDKSKLSNPNAAWLGADDHVYEDYGFSGREDLAHKALAAASQPYRKPVFAGIAPTVKVEG